jgi:hypothetical protein
MMTTTTRDPRRIRGLSPSLSLCSLRGGREDQLVQASEVGVVVEEAAPPVAVTPVRDGMEKKVAAQTAGEVVPMVASFVNVTTSGLLAAPLAPTVRVLCNVCVVPLVPVAKFQVTALVDVLQPVCAVPRVFVVNPPAFTVLAGSCTAEIVTG